MITVALMTFDVTASPGRQAPRAPVQKSFKMVRNDEDHLALLWEVQNEQPVEGTLGIVDWEEFLDQVRKREPHRWTTDEQLPGPMGEGGLPNIMRQLTTTPAYQLFLAAVDVVARLGLQHVGRPEPRHFLEYYVIRAFGALDGFIPTVVEGGRLFFVPDEVLTDKTEAVTELLQNGKLGSVTLTVEGEVPGPKYYIPYAVPGGFATAVTPATRRLWDTIRKQYHAQPY
ncbi:MAG TPA: hypothetical protein VGP76_12950 [Planctomycetaceae bacterium]|jgi:hypothetical protein|nr:hypothetical protein [Planctomycetaceae bacterium]